MDDQNYVDWLIDEKFVDAKDVLIDEARDELKKDLSLRIDTFIMSRALTQLSNENVIEFEKLIKEGRSREDIRKYVSAQIVNFNDFVADCLIEFQTIYLAKQ